jgi:agmatine deiminase
MQKQRMPAEWEPHRATWIAWPYMESDYPGKVDAVRWAYCEFIRHVCRTETVEILCMSAELEADLRTRLNRQQITGNIRIHRTPYNRAWLRDSGPIGVVGTTPKWYSYLFTGWGHLPEVELDQKIPFFISEATGIELIQEQKNSALPVLEGGMLDVSGDGLILVTEECLLSEEQQRNADFTKADYERIFAEHLGASHTIWLPNGVAGDDTHGHIDNVARFVAPRTVVVATARPSDTEQHARLQENVEVLKSYRTPSGEKLEVVELMLPEARYCDDARWPVGYANFYFANEKLLVPTFNDPRDRIALGLLAELVPDREVIGINCADWILGGGTLHCSTQQEPDWEKLCG